MSCTEAAFSVRPGGHQRRSLWRRCSRRHGQTSLCQAGHRDLVPAHVTAFGQRNRGARRRLRVASVRSQTGKASCSPLRSGSSSRGSRERPVLKDNISARSSPAGSNLGRPAARQEVGHRLLWVGSFSHSVLGVGVRRHVGLPAPPCSSNDWWGGELSALLRRPSSIPSSASSWTWKAELVASILQETQWREMDIPTTDHRPWIDPEGNPCAPHMRGA
jgi:hypothetical protein